MRTRLQALAAALALASGSVVAEVLHSEPGEFALRHEVDLEVPSREVYAALVSPSEWWLASHTYSGSAANLSLEAVAGGCFCERWNNASVEHLRVIYALPERELRLRGGLGPLQALAVNDLMRWRLVPRGSGATLTWDYRVAGAASSQLDRLAGTVDQVLGQQLAALAEYLQADSEGGR